MVEENYDGSRSHRQKKRDESRISWNISQCLVSFAFFFRIAKLDFINDNVGFGNIKSIISFGNGLAESKN